MPLPYRDLDDEPYVPLKRKRGMLDDDDPSPPYRPWEGFCIGVLLTLFLVLVISAIVAGAAGQSILDALTDKEAGISETNVALQSTVFWMEDQFATLTALPSVTSPVIPSPTFTATPTQTDLPTATHSPTNTTSPTPSRTPTPTRTPSPNDQFADWLQDIPALIMLENVVCGVGRTDFMLRFEPDDFENFLSVEVSLEVINGEFTVLQPDWSGIDESLLIIIEGRVLPFPSGMSLADANLQFERAVDATDAALTEMTMTWFNPEKQLAMGLMVSANYGDDPRSGVTISVSVASGVEEESARDFRVCR